MWRGESRTPACVNPHLRWLHALVWPGRSACASSPHRHDHTVPIMAHPQGWFRAWARRGLLRNFTSFMSQFPAHGPPPSPCDKTGLAKREPRKGEANPLRLQAALAKGCPSSAPVGTKVT